MTPAAGRSWVLATAGGRYEVGEDPDGAGLVLLAWGRPLGPRPARGFTGPADTAPLEYTANGTRHVYGAELVVRRPGGCDGARLRLVPDSVRLTDDGRTSTLRAVLADDPGGVRVTLHARTCRAHDVVERWARVEASGPQPLRLARAFSGCWNLPVGPGARIGALAGAWSREFTPVDVDLPAGSFSVGSRQGVTSHTYSPVLTVAARSGGTDAYGVALAWSGSWRMQVEAVPFLGEVRVNGGVDDETGVITLSPGQGFDTPMMLGVHSPDGPAGISRAWHDYQRTVLTRDAGPAHRPIVYNSWYATGFDVRPDHQAGLADVAADLGAEVFVLDDGWFAGRLDDTAGLGDWTPDPVRFPDGLGPLADRVLARGLRFGLWIEPEAVNPDSDLYRAHPEWVYRAGERPLVTHRNQYVLDLGRPQVQEWIAGVLRGLLSTLPVSYLKWDMNRPVTDGGRPGDRHGREWSVQHVRAYHRLLDLVRTEFPAVTVEACAAGGGRVDNAVLARADVVWPSDETGPRDRLAIQHGFLSAYPPSVMSSWVTDEPDRLDRRPASLPFRFAVAMAGVLGIGADLLAWDEDRRRLATELLTLYRRIRAVVHHGTVTRHGLPGDPLYAVQYTGTGAEDGRVVVLVWAGPVPPADPRVRPAGLDPGAVYRVEGTDGPAVGGAELAREGLRVPFTLAADCDVLILRRAGRSAPPGDDPARRG